VEGELCPPFDGHRLGNIPPGFELVQRGITLNSLEREGVHGRGEKTEIEQHDKEHLVTTINNELSLQMDLLVVPGRSGLLLSFRATVG
jgi:hypothetical protein